MTQQHHQLTLLTQRIGLDFTRATLEVTRASLESVVATLKHHSRQCINLEISVVVVPQLYLKEIVGGLLEGNMTEKP